MAEIIRLSYVFNLTIDHDALKEIVAKCREDGLDLETALQVVVSLQPYWTKVRQHPVGYTLGQTGP